MVDGKVRLTVDEVAPVAVAIDEIAAEDGVERTHVMRRALRDYISKRKPNWQAELLAPIRPRRGRPSTK